MNIISGGVDSFNAGIYGMPHQNNLDYFKNQINTLSALNVVSNLGKSFIEGAKSVYDRFNSSEALNLVRAVNRQSKVMFQPEMVKSLFDIVDFQTASITMQRWVMANPVVRQMAIDQRINGYSDTYVDYQPGKIAEQQYDYRRVMTGVVQQQDDTWFVKHFIDNLREGDTTLSSFDKLDILNTWKICEMFLQAKQSDPTSPYNDSM